MKIREGLALASQLETVSESARLDTELLLCHALGQSRTYLMTWPDRPLSAEQQARFERLFQQRTEGEPIAYLLGFQAFWTLDLEVSSDTLIPRADTECLVERVLDLSLPDQARVLDLGTGTGAIALALASEKPAWNLCGVDYIGGAVELAQRNAVRLGLSRVEFKQSDWFERVSGTFDLIVSNPPYIDADDPHLQRGDVRFEPQTALVADDSGLADIRLISEQARGYLNAGGWLAFEHGFQQGESVNSLMSELGYVEVATYQDYSGNDRVTMGCWNS